MQDRLLRNSSVWRLVVVRPLMLFSLILDRLDALPAAAQPLLPQTDPIVACADGQDIAAQTPAHTPGDGINVQGGRLPFTCFLLATLSGSQL